MFRTKVVEEIKTQFIFKSFFRELCFLWNNTEKYCTTRQGTEDNIIRRVRIACWKPKGTNTHSEYVILIAFPLQQWLHECALILIYTTIPFLLITKTIEFIFSSRFYTNVHFIYKIQFRKITRKKLTAPKRVMKFPSYF